MLEVAARTQLLQANVLLGVWPSHPLPVGQEWNVGASCLSLTSPRGRKVPNVPAVPSIKCRQAPPRHPVSSWRPQPVGWSKGGVGEAQNDTNSGLGVRKVPKSHFPVQWFSETVSPLTLWRPQFNLSGTRRGGLGQGLLYPLRKGSRSDHCKCNVPRPHARANSSSLE